MNRFSAWLAFCVLLGFLAILAFAVPSLDLIVVIVLTCILAAIDMVPAILRRPPGRLVHGSGSAPADKR